MTLSAEQADTVTFRFVWSWLGRYLNHVPVDLEEAVHVPPDEHLPSFNVTVAPFRLSSPPFIYSDSD